MNQNNQQDGNRTNIGAASQGSSGGQDMDRGQQDQQRQGQVDRQQNQQRGTQDDRDQKDKQDRLDRNTAVQGDDREQR